MCSDAQNSIRRPSATPPSGVARAAVASATTALLYFVFGAIGLAAPFTASNISPVWPAAGVALACLLVYGLRVLPAILVAAFLINFFSGISPFVAIGLAVGNVGSALTSYLLLRRFPGFSLFLTRLKDTLALVLVGALIGPLISATVGVSTLLISGARPWSGAMQGWLMYYLGDAMGILLLTPVALTAKAFVTRLSRARALEFVALLILASTASALLFDGRVYFINQHNVLVLLVLPFVPWAAIRFGLAGVAVANIFVGTIAVVATARGFGPFSADIPFVNALLLQLFLATLSISGLLLSSVIEERQCAEAERNASILQAKLEAESDARKSRALLQSVLDNSPAFIYLKDERGRYQFANRGWEKFFQRSLEGVRNKTDSEIFAEETARQFVTNDQLVLQSNKALEFEEQSFEDGKLRTYHTVKVALRDAGDKLYGICGISTDITERKAREESLKQVHRALRVLSQCTSVVVQATEEQTLLEEVCRIAVGPAGYRMAWVGYAENDEAKTVRPVAWAGPAEGFLDRIRVSWADNEFGRGSIGPAIRTMEPVVVRNLECQPAFGVWRDALAIRDFKSVLSVPLCEGKKAFGALAIYANEPDIFDRSEVELLVELGENLAHGIATIRARKERSEAIKQLEEARLQLEERVRLRTAELEKAKESAESADHLKSAFLATMSHELRTPLNSIIGFTGIVLQELPGPLTGEQKKQLGMVQNSARHLLALINDVLDISKIEAGQLDLHCAPFHLPDSIQKVVTTVTPLAQKKGIALSINVAPQIGMITSDQRRVEQIILNLLGNAIKFTDHGEVTISCRSDGPWLLILVHDTGIGIAPQHQKTIFEPFRQADTGLARSREGTGLGLSICQRLVERLGGFISVESALGEGSTFTVRMPFEWNVHHETNNFGN